MTENLGAFLEDRHEALVSMNLDKINAYMKKYGSAFTLPDNEIGWAAVHKARTACLSLSDEERATSERWLTEHHMGSWS
jgi:hypothetical protein